jgi:hypothetical protein
VLRLTPLTSSVGQPAIFQELARHFLVHSGGYASIQL